MTERENITPQRKSKPIQDEEAVEDDWTEEEILEAAKRIKRRLGIEEEIATEIPKHLRDNG